MAVIETTNLTRRYGKHTAVEGLNLAVLDGEVFGLLGPNGAGKTTTIKILTTLLPPTAGTAQVGGFDVVKRAADVRRTIGYVPQLLSADGALTGYENLLIFAKLYDVPRRERASRIDAALNFMGLVDCKDQLVRQYSGGMIRRLEIAQSLLHRPRVLFLDEPTTGLDPVGRHSVWEHVHAHANDRGVTVFVTTHLMEEADTWCSRLAIMHRGKVAGLGSPAELKASLGRPGATLDDVFIHYSGDSFVGAVSYGEIARGRRNVQRLG
jgi:ABC-2 type transport system ATP-binding protein